MNTGNGADARHYTAEEFAGLVEGVRRSGSGFEARCPAHEDRRQSLSVSEGADGRVLLCCHAGCETSAVTDALGLDLRQLFPATAPPTNGYRRPKAQGPRAATSSPGPTQPPLADDQVEAWHAALKADADAWRHVTETLKLDASVVERLRVGLRVVAGRRWLTYPYRRAGAWTFANSRSLDGARDFVRYPAGQTTSLYLGDSLAEGGTAILVEGEKDAAAALSMRLDVELGGAAGAAVVAIPGVGQVKLAVKALKSQARILVALDADKDGDEAAAEIIKQLGPKAVRLRPPGAKDFGDLLAARGPEKALDLALEAVKAVPVEAKTDKAPAPGLAFVRADGVQVEQVEWIWEGRLAAGKITVLDGDPGTGKTTLALDLAAAISNGTPLPGQGVRTVTRQNVLVFSGEDGLGDTLKPRLDAAGADCTRIYFEDLGNAASLRLMLPRDIDLLEAKILELGIGLIIIDPVMSYLSPDVDSHKDQEVRTALMPLAAMAQRTRSAVILIRHLNKGSGSAIYRGGGSIAFAGVARLVLLAAKDPEDPSAYVLARVKGNLGQPPPALCYALAGAANGSSQVRWGGVSDLSADELLAPPKPGPKPDVIGEAKDYLREVLAAGPKPRQEVLESASKFRFNEKTVQRAAKDLGLRSEPKGRERLWGLP